MAYKQAGGKTIDGAVAVLIAAYFTPPKSDSKKERERKCAGLASCPLKPDVDNIAKIILDGLNGVAFKDDKQVVGLAVSKRYDMTHAGCLVEVREVEKQE